MSDRARFIFDLVGAVATEPSNLLAREDLPRELHDAIETYVAERRRHDAALLVVHREIFSFAKTKFPEAQTGEP